MNRRVRAPGALAEQRGPGIRRGRLPQGSKQGKSGLAIGLLVSRRSSNGRTPAHTSQEMSVRIRRAEPANSGAVLLKQPGPGSQTPGFGPEANDHSDLYSGFRSIFPVSRFGPSLLTDLARHEYPSPRQAN